MIIGCAGSGKTTLAFKLQEKLNLPLIHLDQHYWKPNWQRSNLDDFSQVHDKLCWQDAWIMEGSYMKLVGRRAAHADVIIFLDMPRYLCLWRVIKRSVCNFGKVIPGNPQDCPQQLLSLEYVKFLKWIWNFNRRYNSMIMDVLKISKDNQNVYILRSSKDIAAFCKNLFSYS